MASKIAFISGHRDVTEEEFNEHYRPRIANAVMDGHTFVVGDYYGVDIMAQEYLESLGYDNVQVFHMFVAPRNYVEGFEKRGGFLSDEDRDSAMTHVSDYDIAWVRKGKEGSGTAQNIERREKFHEQLKDMGA